MKTLLCLTLLACHTPKREAIPLLLAGQFDAGTTYHVLTTCPTCYEVNLLLKPFAAHPTVFPAIAAGDGIVLALTHRYGKQHRILRIAVIGAFAGLHVWCGVHNIHLARRYSRTPAAIRGPVYSVPQIQGFRSTTHP